MAKPQLIAETLLLAYLDQQRYILKSNLPHWLLIQVPGWKDAQFLSENFKHVLTRWVRYQTPVYFQYGNHPPFLMQLSEQGDLMDIQIDSLKVNRALLDVFGEMLSNPDRSIGLVRLRDERQISVSGGAEGQFLVGMTTNFASQLKRSEYFHPEDLAAFNQAWIQEMQPNSDRWFEYRYRSFDPLAKNPGPDKCDYIFVSKYRLIEGVSGEMFHMGENIDMVEIA